jgi:hypothetical protein
MLTLSLHVKGESKVDLTARISLRLWLRRLQAIVGGM